MKPPIIGLAGKARAGKDTLAALLVREHGYTRRAFADALKIEYFDTFVSGLPDIITDDEKLAWVNARKHGPVVRSSLQYLGQSRRDADPEYWINQLFEWWGPAEPKPLASLVIPDVRYLNEVWAIDRRGGIVVCVVRPDHDNDLTAEQRAHPSETGLDDYAGMEFIFNDGTPQDMLDQLRAIIDLG